jgi:hypothetical protein
MRDTAGGSSACLRAITRVETEEGVWLVTQSVTLCADWALWSRAVRIRRVYGAVLNRERMLAESSTLLGRAPIWADGKTRHRVTAQAAAGRQARECRANASMDPSPRSYRRITTAGGVPTHLGGPTPCRSWDGAAVATVAARMTSGRKRIRTSSTQVIAVCMTRERLGRPDAAPPDSK